MSWILHECWISLEWSVTTKMQKKNIKNSFIHKMCINASVQCVLIECDGMLSSQSHIKIVFTSSTDFKASLWSFIEKSQTPSSGARRLKRKSDFMSILHVYFDLSWLCRWGFNSCAITLNVRIWWWKIYWSRKFFCAWLTLLIDQHFN